jgi:hypothetical protein
MQRFEAQNAALEKDNIWKRLAELETRYLLQCPKCGKKFWLEPRFVRKAWPGTKVLGYRCPEPGCGGTVDLEGSGPKDSKGEKAA